MTQASDPFSRYIERHTQGRQLVIPDIHGCALTFEALLEVIDLQLQDQLFLLGDYIDRGPDSGRVLLKIQQLIHDGYQVYPLRGNHEQYLLDAYEYYDAAAFKRFLEMNECIGVADENGSLLPPHQKFLENLPYFYETDSFFLVHAGFNWAHATHGWVNTSDRAVPYKSRQPFQDYGSMLEIRDFRATFGQTGNKRVVHGHQVTNLRDIEMSIEQGSTVIPLDNGCCFAKMGAEYMRVGNVIMGNLCCLNLDTLQLTVQPNVDYL
ncbi:MAG: metallophosphoesterase [Bacteroidota bacterium]